MRKVSLDTEITTRENKMTELQFEIQKETPEGITNYIFTSGMDFALAQFDLEMLVSEGLIRIALILPQEQKIVKHWRIV